MEIIEAGKIVISIIYPRTKFINSLKKHSHRRLNGLKSLVLIFQFYIFIYQFQFSISLFVIRVCNPNHPGSFMVY